jgi:hypothetical protein
MALHSTQKKLEGKVHEITLLTHVKQDLDKFIDDLYEKLKNQETAISLEMVNTLKAKLNKLDNKDYEIPQEKPQTNTLPRHSKEKASLDKRAKNTVSYPKLDETEYKKQEAHYNKLFSDMKQKIIKTHYPKPEEIE